MTELEEMLKILSSEGVSYKKRKLQEYFLNNYSPVLESIILKINSPIIFSRFTNIMQHKIDVSELEEKRDDITRKILLNEVDVDNETFSFFKNINSSNFQDYWFTDNEIGDIKTGIIRNNLPNVLKKIASKWLDEYITYYFFHDNYYNYLVNLNQMLRYLRNTKIDLIDKSHLLFYRDCYDISKLSFKEKVQFFKDNYLKKDIQSMFYDDMRIVKNHSYQNLVNSVLKIDEASRIYNEELSKEYEIPIYYLNGEKFNALVRHISENNGRSKEEYEKYVNSNKERDYYSFSYISNRNVNAISTSGTGYILLYSNINPDYITHVYHDDASSSYLVKEKPFITDKFNEIHTPESLVTDTMYYNEIVIKKEEGGIIPSALVCYDEINDKQIVFAKEHHLPIVLINLKKYQQRMGYTDFNNYDTYSL